MISAIDAAAKKGATFAIVVGVHLLVLFGLSQVRFEKSVEPHQVHTTWLVIPRPDLKIDKSTSKLKQPGGAVHSTNRASDSPLVLDPPPSATQQPGIDWRAEGAKSARDVGIRRADEQRIAPIVPDPVISTAGHKRGDSERSDDGEIVTWLDNTCYATNKDFGEQRWNANTVVVVCKGNVGTPPARRDMFDHLKPAYLRNTETKPVDADPSKGSHEAK